MCFGPSNTLPAKTHDTLEVLLLPASSSKGDRVIFPKLETKLSVQPVRLSLHAHLETHGDGLLLYLLKFPYLSTSSLCGLLCLAELHPKGLVNRHPKQAKVWPVGVPGSSSADPFSLFLPDTEAIFS